MNWTRNLIAALFVVTATSGFAEEPKEAPAAPAGQQEEAPKAEQKAPGEWEFEVAPYLWWSGVKSTVELGPVKTSSDIGFLDALDHLKFGGLIHAEANNGRWGIMGDVVYLKLGEAAEKRIGPKLKLIRVDAKADLAQSMVELGGFYRISSERRSFDILAGGRYFGFDTDVDFGPVSVSREKDWVDPFIGGRFSTMLSERWAFSVRGDIGGFGVGSDFTWNAAALFRYRLTENSDLGFGYRYLDVEKSSDSGSYDSVTSGPLLGMSIKF